MRASKAALSASPTQNWPAPIVVASWPNWSFPLLFVVFSCALAVRYLPQSVRSVNVPIVVSASYIHCTLSVLNVVRECRYAESLGVLMT